MCIYVQQKSVMAVVPTSFFLRDMRQILDMSKKCMIFCITEEKNLLCMFAFG